MALASLGRGRRAFIEPSRPPLFHAGGFGVGRVALRREKDGDRAGSARRAVLDCARFARACSARFRRTGSARRTGGRGRPPGGLSRDSATRC